MLVNESASEVRKNFHHYLEWVASGQGRVRIVRHLTSRAVLVSEADAERLFALDRAAHPARAAAAEKDAEETAAFWRADDAIRAKMGLRPIAR